MCRSLVCRLCILLVCLFCSACGAREAPEAAGLEEAPLVRPRRCL